MDQNGRSRRGELPIDSFSNEASTFDRTRVRRQSGGFVDLGNESQYGTGGHQASGANEIFADMQVYKQILIPFLSLVFFLPRDTIRFSAYVLTLFSGRCSMVEVKLLHIAACLIWNVGWCIHILPHQYIWCNSVPKIWMDSWPGWPSKWNIYSHIYW